MPRPASIGVAGYYPTPQPLLPTIAALVDMRQLYQPTAGKSGTCLVCDPCAGDGRMLKQDGDTSIGQLACLCTSSLWLHSQWYWCVRG